MKLYKNLTLMVLLGMTLVLFGMTSSAYATPIDPTIITHKLDPTCGGAIICYNGSAPLSLVFSPTISVEFVYEPANPASLLTNFFLNFTNVPVGTAFQCETNIWVNCSIAGLAGNVTQFHMSGGYHGVLDPIGTMNCNFNDGAGGKCPGYLASGEGASITGVPLVSETPEPASFLLFGTGLVSILATAKRRFHTPT